MTDRLEIYEEPLPFVAEIWSRSMGRYDVDAKIPEYKERCDSEIWRLHPYERTVTAWRRQAVGSFTESVFRGGKVRLHSLPDVTVDIDALFARVS
jgi:Uma2 family endonuclease